MYVYNQFSYDYEISTWYYNNCDVPYTRISWLFYSILMCLKSVDTIFDSILMSNICTFPCRMISTWTNLWLIAESVSSWRRCVKIWSNITDSSKQPWSNLSIKTMQILLICPPILWVFVLYERYTMFSADIMCYQRLFALSYSKTSMSWFLPHTLLAYCFPEWQKSMYLCFRLEWIKPSISSLSLSASYVRRCW